MKNKAAPLLLQFCKEILSDVRSRNVLLQNMKSFGLHLSDCSNTHGKHWHSPSEQALKLQCNLQRTQLAEIVLPYSISAESGLSNVEQCSCVSALDNNLSSPFNSPASLELSI